MKIFVGDLGVENIFTICRFFFLPDYPNLLILYELSYICFCFQRSNSGSVLDWMVFLYIWSNTNTGRKLMGWGCYCFNPINTFKEMGNSYPLLYMYITNDLTSGGIVEIEMLEKRLMWYFGGIWIFLMDAASCSLWDYCTRLTSFLPGLRFPKVNLKREGSESHVLRAF